MLGVQGACRPLEPVAAIPTPALIYRHISPTARDHHSSLVVIKATTCGMSSWKAAMSDPRRE
jgi:hypothetical protein